MLSVAETPPSWVSLCKEAIESFVGESVEVPAAETIVAPSTSSHVVITDDLAEAANRLSLQREGAVAGQLLLVHNADAQPTVDVVVPPLQAQHLKGSKPFELTPLHLSTEQSFVFAGISYQSQSLPAVFYVADSWLSSVHL